MGSNELKHQTLVDVHSHILPGLDDGAQDSRTMLEMLRISESEGVKTIVATPHASHTEPDRIRTAVESARVSARQHGLSLEILAGSEIKFSADLASRYQEGELLGINESSYLLIEFPFTRPWPPLLKDAIYMLRVAGGLPIIAHAERYPAVQADPKILLPLVELGLLVQVNAEALTETYQSASARTAETLVRGKLVHLVASDAHDTTRRPPHIREALERVAMISDETYREQVMRSAELVSCGEPVVIPLVDSDALQTPTRTLNPLKLWRRGH